MTFEDYLVRKKIDQKAFAEAEKLLFESWKSEFEQMHPDSFTIQKLNLINPVRRKYTLKEVIKATLPEEVKSDQGLAPLNTIVIASPNDDAKPESAEIKPPAAPKPVRPVFKPRPKIN
jgi:hypothetical protein